MRALKTAFTFVAALAGLTSLTSCKEEPAENFGTVKIEIEPIPDPSVLAGTTEVTATVVYQKCLQDFYLLERPEYQQVGVEGDAVFSEFAERLCDPGLDKNIDCEVTDIQQSLVESTKVYTLRVTYKINDPSSLAYANVHVGPLPLEDFVGACEGGPVVELNQNGLIGRNADGVQIWSISALPSPNEALPGQGAPLRVQVSAD